MMPSRNGNRTFSTRRVVMNPIIQCVDNARVFFGWIEHPAVAQHIVEHDQPALAHQLHTTVVIVIVARFVGIDKTEIEGALQCFQCVGGPALPDFDLVAMRALGEETPGNVDGSVGRARR